MDQQTIDLIVELINNYLPSVVAVVVAICSMIVAVKKVTNVSNESVNTLKANNKALSSELAESKRENRELKKLLEEDIALRRKIKKPEAKGK